MELSIYLVKCHDESNVSRKRFQAGRVFFWNELPDTATRDREFIRSVHTKHCRGWGLQCLPMARPGDECVGQCAAYYYLQRRHDHGPCESTGEFRKLDFAGSVQLCFGYVRK